MKKPVLVIMAAGMGSRYGCLLYTSLSLIYTVTKHVKFLQKQELSSQY